MHQAGFGTARQAATSLVADISIESSAHQTRHSLKSQL